MQLRPRAKAYLLTALIATPLIVAYFLSPAVQRTVAAIAQALRSANRFWLPLLLLAALLILAFLVVALTVLNALTRTHINRELRRKGKPPLAARSPKGSEESSRG